VFLQQNQLSLQENKSYKTVVLKALNLINSNAPQKAYVLNYSQNLIRTFRNARILH
jgi:hypothetical protein